VASQDWPEITKYSGLVCAQAHRQELIQDLFKQWQDPVRGTVTGGMIKYLSLSLSMPIHVSVTCLPMLCVFYSVLYLFFWYEASLFSGYTLLSSFLSNILTGSFLYLSKEPQGRSHNASYFTGTVTIVFSNSCSFLSYFALMIYILFAGMV